MTELIRNRPFAGLLLLVVLNLFLLSVQIRSEDGRVLLRSWGLTLFSPLAMAANATSGFLRELWTRYDFLNSLEARNRYLEAENWRLQAELHRLEAMRRLIERDPAFDRLQEQFSFQILRAAVVWRNLPVYSERVVVNAGERHGVLKDTAVMTPKGVVGRVMTTTPFSAEVELLIDVNAAAGAIVGAERYAGVVQGVGSGVLELNFIPASARVLEGDEVVTSGTDGIYPKGIPIGTVSSVGPGTGVYQSLRVRPWVDFTRLEEVALVLDKH